jgi:large subunit ribosomal protein L22
MPHTATHKFARMSARKARLVMDLVRGRDVDDALSVLEFNKRRAGAYIARTIKSAVGNYHNAVDNNNATPGSGALYISEARADEGPTIKRFQPKDRGKAHPIMKRTSHLIITVDER